MEVKDLKRLNFLIKLSDCITLLDFHLKLMKRDYSKVRIALAGKYDAHRAILSGNFDTFEWL